MKITVVGAGYVGMSLAILLAQKHEVIVFDIDSNKVDKINCGICPIKDDLAELIFAQGIKISATIFLETAYKDTISNNLANVKNMETGENIPVGLDKISELF